MGSFYGFDAETRRGVTAPVLFFGTLSREFCISVMNFDEAQRKLFLTTGVGGGLVEFLVSSYFVCIFGTAE
jgi:hypothetical protein